MKIVNIIRGGILSVIALNVLTGCGTKDTIPPIQNSKIATHSLYVNSFDKINNKSFGYGFELNSYKPINYDTRTYTTNYGSILFADGTNNQYEINECKKIPSEVLMANILAAPFTMGLNLLSGGLCKHRHTFGFEEFDDDAKEWVEDNDINREKIINKHDSLIALKESKEANLNSYAEEQTTQLNNLYTDYSTAYSKYPLIKLHYNDNSSLYNNELLTAKATFVETRLNRENITTNLNYQNEVNSAFPCKSTNECTSNIDKSIKQIKNKYLSDMGALKKESLSKIATYEQTLKNKTKMLSIKYDKNLRSDIFKDKTVHYKIRTKDAVESKAKKLDITYEIQYIDYKNIYPSFQNKNKDLVINFDSNTKTITYENLTNKYIQINSVDLYYGSNIYTITNNINHNYSTELSPEAYKSAELFQTIPESSYKNMTKKQALTKKITFGFSVKYTVGDSTKNKTLYKRDKTSLYSLIKNK